MGPPLSSSKAVRSIATGGLLRTAYAGTKASISGGKTSTMSQWRVINQRAEIAHQILECETATLAGSQMSLVQASRELAEVCWNVLTNIQMDLNGHQDHDDEHLETEADMLRRALAAWSTASAGMDRLIWTAAEMIVQETGYVTKESRLYAQKVERVAEILMELFAGSRMP